MRFVVGFYAKGHPNPTGSLNFVRNFGRQQVKGTTERPSRLQQPFLDVADIGFDCLESLAKGRGPIVGVEAFTIRPVADLSDKSVQVPAVFHDMMA